MSIAPHSIGDDQSIASAKERMQRFGIRHLPVLHGGRLVGVVSERDIALLEAVEADASEIRVAETVTDRVLAVTPDEPLSDVAAEMARARIGSAVVVDEGEVVGIFTAVDACRASRSQKIASFAFAGTLRIM